MIEQRRKIGDLFALKWLIFADPFTFEKFLPHDPWSEDLLGQKEDWDI